jgi:hypothetical protein
MDLLMKLSEYKAKAVTYVRNNFKIRKIVANQTKKESILKTVDRVKQKLIRWRKFTRTTLMDEKKLKDMKDTLREAEHENEKDASYAAVDDDKPTSLTLDRGDSIQSWKQHAGQLLNEKQEKGEEVKAGEEA